jgi:hypothetical protein
MTYLRTAALTAAAFTIGAVIGLSLTAAADTPHSCPPPSAQLAAAQGSVLIGTGCSELGATTPGADPTNADDTGHTSTRPAGLARSHRSTVMASMARSTSRRPA